MKQRVARDKLAELSLKSGSGLHIKDWFPKKQLTQKRETVLAASDVNMWGNTVVIDSDDDSDPPVRGGNASAAFDLSRFSYTDAAPDIYLCTNVN